MMKKFPVACLALTLSFGTVGIVCQPRPAAAALAKVSLTINGASYYGEVKNGKPSGKGTMKWVNESYDANDNSYDENKWIAKTYSGDWVNGKRSGQGKYVVEKPYDDFEIYDGAWKNGSKNGQGIAIVGSRSDSENDVQIGQFFNNSFKSGYAGYTDVTGYWMEYKDTDTYIRFVLPYDEEQAFLNGKFKTNSDVNTFYYQKKQKNGSVKGFSYNVFRMAAWEAYAYEGTYNKIPTTWGDFSNYLNGTLKQENYDLSNSDAGLVETYKFVDGKQTLKQRQSVKAGDPIHIQAKINSRLVMLKPYLGGFKKTFDLMAK